MVKIYIDAGHGGNDPGVSGNGLKEKDLTLDIAKRIKKYLGNNYSGHSIKMSRTTDKTLSLSQRTNEANSWGADYFLSVHINSGGGTGYEDYIYSGAIQKQTASIRDTIHAEIVKQIPEVTNRGKKRANLHVTRESRMPSALTESLFIDTKKDADKLKDSSFLDKLAKGHAIGLAKAFSLKSKSGASSKPSTSKPSKPKPKPKPTTTNTSSKGKRVESKVNDLRFYNKPSWSDKHVVGTVNKGYGFPIIVRKLKVGSAYQYEVKNSKGVTYYITAASKYVKVIGGKSKSSKPKTTAFKVGNTVTLKKSATHFATGQSILNSAKGKKYKILQVKSDRVLLNKIMSWVKKSDVQ